MIRVTKMKSRQKKYKLTGQQLSEIFGIAVSSCQQLRRFSDMPDTDNKEKLIEWYEEHKKKVSAKMKKLKHYKLSNSTISGLLKLSGKRTANKVSELRYAGLPDTSNLEEVKNWYKQWKEKQPKLEKLATLQSIGNVLGVTRERVRQFKEMGMPFNESSSPIEDAVAWHKWRQKQVKKTQGKGKTGRRIKEVFLNLSKEKTNEFKQKLNLNHRQLAEFISKGMPTRTSSEASNWLEENTLYISGKLKVKSNENIKVFIYKSLRLNAPQFEKFIKLGMSPDSLEQASLWIKENTYKTSSGTIKVKSDKNMRIFIYKSLGINGAQFDKFVKLGMSSDSLEQASRWFKENTYKTPRGMIKISRLSKL